MMQNRAVEFLTEAYGLMEYYGNQHTARALVRLAIEEVRELLEQLEQYEAPASYQVLVEVAPPMRQAQLTATRRPLAALPNNGDYGHCTGGK